MRGEAPSPPCEDQDGPQTAWQTVDGEQAAARRHGARNRLGTMSCYHYSKISESLRTAYTARQDITYQFAERETHDATWANVWGRIGGTVPPGALLAPY